MGVGGNFWDLLKPYGRNEGMDFLRNKRVAVDLSFWIVQHETAIRNSNKSSNSPVRTPHLRVTFFRTIHLFAKMGAFPVFVVDGQPSPLKARARMERFFRASGIDLSPFKVDEGVLGVQRNQAFTRCVTQCVDLLELLGMPVIRARSEAEALCAQLNSEGHVDACITADSDAFLFGAKCVIKSLRCNSKEPFECYHVSDVEAGLGLKRKHLVAVSLLVGNDHDLHGVPGIGLDTAVRFVRLFSDTEILDRLCEIGKGSSLSIHNNVQFSLDVPSSDASSARSRSHCSKCGHPGSKKAHLKIACEYCSIHGNENCILKIAGFKCECTICDKSHRSKEQKKRETWKIRICQKIAAEKNFPNSMIIEIYLSNKHGDFSGCPSLLWNNPKIEDLVDFLSYHQHWDPSYTRQRILPMLSTIFLREKASNPNEGLLLYGQYEFHSIQRIKVRYGHSFYVVKWKRNAPSTTNLVDNMFNEQSDNQQREISGPSTDLFDEPEVPLIIVDDGSWFLLTDENIELVQAAFPQQANSFLHEKELKESKLRKRKSSLRTGENSESPKSTGVQLSITEFYRSTKSLVQSNTGEDLSKKSPEEWLPRKCQKKSAAYPKQNFSKSVRRRLLFD